MAAKSDLRERELSYLRDALFDFKEENGIVFGYCIGNSYEKIIETVAAISSTCFIRAEVHSREKGHRRFKSAQPMWQQQRGNLPIPFSGLPFIMLGNEIRNETLSSRLREGLQKQLYHSCSSGNLDELLQIVYHNPAASRELITGNQVLMETAACADDNKTPQDYMHVACRNGHLDVVQQLVSLGGVINHVVEDLTPLSVACDAGHLEIVKFLMSNSATLHSSEENQDALSVFMACKAGHCHIVEYLVSENPGVIQTHGQLLLYTSCKEGHLDIVKLLLKKGVSINSKCSGAAHNENHQNTQALHGACVGQQAAVVKYLIENGAEVNDSYIENFWEIIGEVLLRFTRETTNKKSTSLPFDTDPSVPMFSANWKEKNLCSLHKAWFINWSARLVSIDLSGNRLSELPEELLNVMPALEMLDVSHNQLVSLPEVTSSYVRLQRFYATNNSLSFISPSLFNIRSLRKLNLSQNQISSLTSDPDATDDGLQVSATWQCTSLKILNLSHNSLQYLPMCIEGANGLVNLFLDHNELKSFPLPWKCPLECLDLSNNKLTDFRYNVEMVWAGCLKQLNLSHNQIDAISWNICQLAALQKLDLSHNAIKKLPDIKPPNDNFWKCSTLHELDLSFNKIAARVQIETSSNSLRRFPFLKSPSQDEELRTDAEFPAVFAATLEQLKLNNNQLQVVPLSMCKLTRLTELDLSNNPDLRTLPPELGNLRDCWHLKLNKLNLALLPKHVRPGMMGVRPRDTMAFLRATLRKSVPYYRMKLMVVGLQGRGKTTLLASLKGQKLPKDISTVGIVIDEWPLQVTTSFRASFPRVFLGQSDSPVVTFSTWDLAGQHVYYAAHQMFLSPNTLYLAVWNVTHGEEGVETLRRWLLNIQARAPQSDVLVVGTHLDMLPRKGRESRVDRLKLTIMEKYSDNKGFPNLVGNIVVSATTGENIPELRDLIYTKALKAKDHIVGKGEMIIGKQVPLSYTQLQEAVVREAENRRNLAEPPILLEEELLDLAKSCPDNDIRDTEELALATRFLHENGILLHFNDQLRGLSNLYFIDPAWVCDLIATIVTVREKNPFIKNGSMKKKDIELVLRNPRFPTQFIMQYLQLMERFEIALSMDDEQLLIPSMLPQERPGMDLHRMQRMWSKQKSAGHETAGSSGRLDDILKPQGVEVESVDCVRRQYQMSYIPSGFWSRLVTRLMVSVQRWRNAEGIDDEKYSLIYWREGLGVVYQGGHFLVESYRDLVPMHASRARFTELDGVSITVYSSINDFSVMGFIVDQTDALISEWYPGLDETDNFGYPLVVRLIPCPRCETFSKSFSSGPRLKRAVSMDFPPTIEGVQHLRPHCFTLPTCAAVAPNFDSIACPNHPDVTVPLKELIPDLLLTDLPSHLLIDPSKFNFTATDEDRLGSGGAGEVFRGTYADEPVAVKIFHSTRSASHVYDSGLGVSGIDSTRAGSCFRRGSRSEGSALYRSAAMPTEDESMEDELEKTKVVRAFWDLRQEVAVLCRLQNPCVVTLLGVCLHPLCFILELAPMGSLSSVLDDRLAEGEGHVGVVAANDNRPCVLGRLLTYRIAYQVASALWYLHDCDVIYRDLKSDNVLVWNLDETALLNVKISDYGISRFATPQGVAGVEGTPGYQAPEIRPGIGYDEKVDIFSFAIFLFELFSGCRPFRDYRNPGDIKKAIRRGIRPSLEQHYVDTELPRLEELMTCCWQELPELRPSAGDILKEMEDPAFLCHSRTMPSDGVLEKITAIYGMSQATPGNLYFKDGRRTSREEEKLSEGFSSNFVLLWARERDERNYSMLNCETGYYAHEQSFPGHRVLSMARVGNRTWLGTEGRTIEVFGRRSWRPPSTLWKYIVRAPVLALLTEETADKPESSETTAEPPSAKVKKVYAGLANGTVVVVGCAGHGDQQSHSEVNLVVEDDSDERVKREAETWHNTQVVNLGQGGSPVNCMVLASHGTQLWVGCGRVIVVVDCSTLTVLDEIWVYHSQRAHIRRMVTDGVDKVWSIDRRSTKILQWDVRTHRLTHIFECDIHNPVGQFVCCTAEDAGMVGAGEKTGESQSGTTETRDNQSRSAEMTGSQNDEKNQSSDNWNKDSLKFSETTLDDVSGDELSKSDMVEGESLADRGNTSKSFSPVKTTNPSDDQLQKHPSPPSVVVDIPVPEAITKREPSVSGISLDSGISPDDPSTSGTSSQASSGPSLHVPSEGEWKNGTQSQDSENTDHTDESRDFELVDREESKKVFISGVAAKRKLTGRRENQMSCASMTSLERGELKPVARGPSIIRSVKQKSTRRSRAVGEGDSVRENIRWQPRLRVSKVVSGSSNSVTAILLVKGTLWVGRSRGDTLIVNVTPQTSEHACVYGQILAQLDADNVLGYANGRVDDIISTGANKVVCRRRLEPLRLPIADQQKRKSRGFSLGPGPSEDPFTERYQLLVWEAWGYDEFKGFKSYDEKFKELFG